MPIASSLLSPLVFAFATRIQILGLGATKQPVVCLWGWHFEVAEYLEPIPDVFSHVVVVPVTNEQMSEVGIQQTPKFQLPSADASY